MQNENASLLSLEEEPWARCQSDVLALRSLAGVGAITDTLDSDSWHTVARMNGQVVGALRVASANKAALDFESHLPFPLSDELRPSIGSASRLVIKNGAPIGLMPALVRHAWAQAYQRGKRMDIIAAPARLAPIYARRFGYEYLSSTQFNHARTGRPVQVMSYVLSERGQGIYDGPHLGAQSFEDAPLYASLRNLCTQLRLSWQMQEAC